MDPFFGTLPAVPSKGAGEQLETAGSSFGGERPGDGPIKGTIVDPLCPGQLPPVRRPGQRIEATQVAGEAIQNRSLGGFSVESIRRTGVRDKIGGVAFDHNSCQLAGYIGRCGSA